MWLVVETREIRRPKMSITQGGRAESRHSMHESIVVAGRTGAEEIIESILGRAGSDAGGAINVCKLWGARAMPAGDEKQQSSNTGRRP